MRRFTFGLLLATTATLAGCNRPAATDAHTTPTDGNVAAPGAARHLAAETPKPSAPAVEAAGATAVVTAPVNPAVSPAPAASAVPVVSEPAEREITIPAGTPLRLALTSGVSSNGSSVEDGVSATLGRAIVVDGMTVVPAGVAVRGHVTEATRSARVKGRARIGLRFTSLATGGTRYDIRTAAVAREARGTKKDAVKIGVGAGAGALVGALSGGKKGAAIGTAVGAGGGTGVVLATRGEEVALGAGSVVTTRLTAPLTVRVRAK